MAWEGRYLNMMNQWLILKQEGKSIDRYIKKHGYSTVAVYGMAVYGRHVIRELQNTDIKIVCGIDRKKMETYKNIEILLPAEGLPPADVIINTVIHDHIGIKDHLAQLTVSPVVSLEDVIFESYS